MDRWANKVAVVTGASSGIGLACARLFVKKGLIVVGLARRKDKMEADMAECVKKGPGRFYAQKCDVTKEEDLQRVFDWVKKSFGTVNILVNNAGAFKSASIEDVTTEEMLRIINLNIVGLLHATRICVKMMRENGEDAHVVNISSILGHKVPIVPGLSMNVYSPTKFFVRALSEICRVDLSNSKIRVSNISPGYVKTEIFEVADMDTTMLTAAPALESEDVADAVAYIISTPEHVNISELTIKPRGEMF